MIEQKFRKFRNSLTDEQFEDPVYLEGQARIIAISDAALSNRILEKAKSYNNKKLIKSMRLFVEIIECWKMNLLRILHRKTLK